jgi:hypothetical protein
MKTMGSDPMNTMKNQHTSSERVTPIRRVDGLATGRAALARGDWEAAQLAFEQSLLTGEHPEALEGLGLAAWWVAPARSSRR